MNLTDAINRYPAHLQGRGIGVETQKKYLYELRQLSKLIGADKWPTYPVLADWQASHPNVSAVTLHHKVTTVKAFFRWALDMEYISEDPAARLVVPKRPKKQAATLSQSVVAYLLGGWEPYYMKRDTFLVARDKAMVKVFIMTGLRRAELTNLNVGDISLEGRAVAVRAGKGGKDRTVVIPKNVIPELRVLTEGRKYNEPLFTGKGGNRLKPNAINEMFKRKISKALGRNVTPHQCRHAYATFLVSKGIPLHQLQENLGHESLATTERYLHATTRDRLLSVDVLDELV